MYDLYKDMGKRISELRRAHGFTQETFSVELDITAKHVSYVERGVSSLSLEKLVDACDILDCSLDYLVLGKDYTDTIGRLPASIVDILSSNDEEEIALLSEYLNLYSRLRPTKNTSTPAK